MCLKENSVLIKVLETENNQVNKKQTASQKKSLTIYQPLATGGGGGGGGSSSNILSTSVNISIIVWFGKDGNEQPYSFAGGSNQQKDITKQFKCIIISTAMSKMIENYKKGQFESGHIQKKIICTTQISRFKTHPEFRNSYGSLKRVVIPHLLKISSKIFNLTTTLYGLVRQREINNSMCCSINDRKVTQKASLRVSWIPTLPYLSTTL
ncbi:hypothetical protein ACTA71_004160 [Dictyostelium dimigraforme]